MISSAAGIVTPLPFVVLGVEEVADGTVSADAVEMVFVEIIGAADSGSLSGKM
jgi:hypothetical protein